MRYSMGKLRALGVGMITALFLAACGGGGDDGATAPGPIAPVASGTLTGKAVDGSTGSPIAGATVSAGGVSTTTAADGSFTLAGVPPAARVPVTFTSTSHAEGSRIAEVVVNATTDVQARLVPVGTVASIPVATGGTVTVPGSTAQVTLAANAVQRADGSAPTGNFTVRLTPINPAVDTQLMPGDFIATSSAGNVPIESFGAIDVALTDSAGAALNLRSGQTATIRIPVASRNSVVPATIPLYYYNAATGLWQQEGSATLAGAGSDSYYEGTVTHFSTWNADQTYNTIFVRGCVKDAAGVVVANALVGSDGIDYSGTSTVMTDANGNFSLPIRTDSVAAIAALSGTRLTNTLRNEPSTTDLTLPECLTLGQAGAGLTMKLTWGALPSDLDSHLITPGGEEIAYYNRGGLVSEPFANLDVDDTDSYGPEVITISRLMVGTYKYAVFNYSGYEDGPISLSGARVELNLPGQSVQLITPPASGDGVGVDYWNLFELDVSANCTITVRTVQTFSADGPSIPALTTPQYCTP